jgi:methyl-accepting chemotaxis protein
MRLTIGKRIILGFTLTVSITAALGAFVYHRLAVIEGHIHELDKEAMPAVYNSEEIKSRARASYALVLEHITAGSPADQARIDEEITSYEKKITQAVDDFQGTVNTDRERELFAAVAPAREAYASARQDVMALSRGGKRDDAMAAVHATLKPAVDKFVAAARALTELSRESGERFFDETIAAAAGSRTACLIGVGSGLALGALLAFFISRGINRALNRMSATLGDGSAQVASAASQVSSSSQSLAQGASEQAASLGRPPAPSNR